MIGAGSLLAPGHWMPLVAVAVSLNIVMYYSDRLVLRMQRASELNDADHPALHRMNEELAHAAGIPAPRLYLVNAPNANAFATGRGPGHATIAVTQACSTAWHGGRFAASERMRSSRAHAFKWLRC